MNATWRAAEVAGTDLHMTLVPPLGTRPPSEDRERREVLKRLRSKHGAKVGKKCSFSWTCLEVFVCMYA